MLCMRIHSLLARIQDLNRLKKELSQGSHMKGHMKPNAATLARLSKKAKVD